MRMGHVRQIGCIVPSSTKGKDTSIQKGGPFSFLMAPLQTDLL